MGCDDLCSTIDFSSIFLTPAHPHAQSLFLFPIVFGINLVSDAVCCLIDCYYSCCCPSLPSRETVYRVDGFLALKCVFLQWQLAFTHSRTL